LTRRAPRRQDRCRVRLFQSYARRAAARLRVPHHLLFQAGVRLRLGRPGQGARVVNLG
jgi:hypothetical protein